MTVYKTLGDSLHRALLQSAQTPLDPRLPQPGTVRGGSKSLGSCQPNRQQAIIERHPEGVSAEEVLQESGLALQRRSLQRRLAVLVEQGRIRVQGQARAVRYFPGLQDQRPSGMGSSSAESETEPYVPVSPEGEAIKAYVRQPRHLRKPVVYRTEFLEKYHPNHTAYLPLKLREQLHALGRSPAEQTPAGTFARDILNRLLIDLSWASSQLEGNTYSRLV